MEEFKEREARKAEENAAAAASDESSKENKRPNVDSGDQTGQELSAEQQQLMDESGKMLEHLRKEVFRLRGQNQQLKTDFDLLKDNNQRLMDANASAGASFAALNQHAKQLSKQNAQLVNDVQGFKGQVQKLTILQVEAKEVELVKPNASARLDRRMRRRRRCRNPCEFQSCFADPGKEG